MLAALVSIPPIFPKTKILLDDPSGTVIDYKMTDGTGIGLVLKLSDGSFIWFFQDELLSSCRDEFGLSMKDQNSAVATLVSSS